MLSNEARSFHEHWRCIISAAVNRSGIIFGSLNFPRGLICQELRVHDGLTGTGKLVDSVNKYIDEIEL